MRTIALFIVWLALAAVGAWGLWLRLTTGHELATYGSYVPWGLWVAAYIYFAGLSAGAFAVAGIAVVFKQERLRPLVPLALLTALAALVAGLVIIWLDLGHMWRMFNLFLRPNFSSMMSIVVWMYAVYGILLASALYATLRGRQRRADLLIWLAAPIALFFPGASGALFGTVLAQEMWNSPIYPVLFLTGGILSGIALMTALSGAFGASRGWAPVTRYLGRVTLALLAFYTLLELAEYSIPLWYRVGHEYDAVMGVLTGPYWYVYWVFHLALGVVVPAALLIGYPGRVALVSLAGALTAASFLAVRINLVIPSQTHPQLAGLVNAYRDERLSYAYLPSAFEWAIVAGAVALAMAIFAIGVALFPRVTLQPGPTDPDVTGAPGARRRVTLKEAM
jgi:protein NrfD